MRKLIVGVDVDETVCDMLGAICARGLSEGAADYQRLPGGRALLAENIEGWGLPKWMYRFMDSELYDFWARPIQGARKAIDMIRGAGHRVVFVTSCVANTTDAKGRWLVRWGFTKDVNKELIAAADKSLVGVDVLVDDAPHNVDPFPGEAILIDQPHNRSHVTVRPRASIEQVPALIQQIAESSPHDLMLERLAPIAAELATGSRRGITVTEVRREAIRRGIVRGNETREQMSALGHVMLAAGLWTTGETRRSTIEKTHRNLQRVWYAPVAN